MALEDTDDVATFFQDDAPNAKTALYQPVAGGSSSVTVLWDCAQVIGNLGRAGMAQENDRLQVMRAAVPDPSEGDVFVVDAVNYNFGERELDPTGQIWSITVHKQE